MGCETQLKTGSASPRCSSDDAMIRRAVACRRLFLGACLAPVAACGDDPATTTAVVFDSAGITIAASPADALSGLRAWRLAEPPQLVIRNLEDDPNQRLGRVASATLLPNGTILVGDAEMGDVRLFGADGRTLRQLELLEGGKKRDDAPAEREAGSASTPAGRSPRLAIALLPGDTIVASAWSFGLSSRFTLEGIHLGSARLAEAQPVLVAEIMRDESLLYDLYDRGYEEDIETWAAYGMEPLFRPRGWLVRAFPDGRRYTLREIGGRQWFKRGQPGLDLWYGPRPFGPTSTVAVAGSRIYFGDTERAEVEVLSPTGELRGLVRWEDAAVPVTDADRASVREYALASLRRPERRGALEAWLDEVPYPAYKPAFDALFSQL